MTRRATTPTAPAARRTPGGGATAAPIIRYGFHPTPYGEGFIATTVHGICRLTFVESGRRATLARVAAEFPGAIWVEDVVRTTSLMTQAFDAKRNQRLALDLSGTPFQRRVWSELLQIPRGAMTTYGGLAARIGRPSASRAVGSAVGANPVCFVVPCHRVVRGDGTLGGYAWGPEMKAAMLGEELGLTPPARRRG
ncbi:MAG: methylated-DNA--[protein]-cysteine S-methyltransferase [Gemmatimonadetes bacterium]|nr:methylated-DNA--[protein]-cysteine S-methyltransferase [Gemmatimonadota bacterium]